MSEVGTTPCGCGAHPFACLCAGPSRRLVHVVRDSTELRHRALTDLKSLGFLQRAPEETTGKAKGGRPSTGWIANPAIHENTGQDGQKSAPAQTELGVAVLSVLSGESEELESKEAGA